MAWITFSMLLRQEHFEVLKVDWVIIGNYRKLRLLPSKHELDFGTRVLVSCKDLRAYRTNIFEFNARVDTFVRDKRAKLAKHSKKFGKQPTTRKSVVISECMGH